VACGAVVGLGFLPVVTPAGANVVDDTTAYVWANQPTASSYTPAAAYSYNNLAGTNTITRLAQGEWMVDLGSLGTAAATSGTVDVTPYGATPADCSVVGWGPSGSDAIVYVDCYTLSGAPLDTYFTLDFTSLNEPLFAFNESYAWADQPSTFQYTPDTTYNYSDLPLASYVHASHLGTGEYLLSVDETNATTVGTFKVTPYGAGGGTCNLVSFNNSGGTFTSVEMTCFNAAGAPADRQFTETWTTGSLDGTSYQYGYALANRPTTAHYTPILSYQKTSVAKGTGKVTITRTGTGTYQVAMSRLPRNGGNVQVTALGNFTSTNHCQVVNWGPEFSTGAGQLVNVDCFDNTGAPADSDFTVQWERL
jgi:hypothetical protein